MKTLKLNKTFAVLMLACMTLASADLFAQYSGLRIEDDGFSWNRVCQDGKEGAKSTNGSWIIPLSRGYTIICYHTGNGGWFHVEKNSDSWGACDKNGREIVAPGRYDKVYYYNRKDGYVYCYVELNGKMGVCDENGREVIAPRYEDLYYDDFFDHVFQYKDASGNYVSLGNPLQKSSSSAYASSSTTGGSSSSSSGGKSGGSSSSGGKSDGTKLLYQGDYTEGTAYGQRTGYSIPPAMPTHWGIKIYEDCLEDMGTWKYEGMSIDGHRIYGGTAGFGSSAGRVQYFVDGNFNITFTREVCAMDCDLFISQFSKGNSTFNINDGSQSTYTGGNKGNDGNKGNTTTTQTKQHKCGVCGGTGREIRTDAASFGKTKYCSECGKTVPDYHYHAPCRSCGGKGWW